MRKRVNQKNNDVGGDLIGNDKNEYNIYNLPESPISELLEKFNSDDDSVETIHHELAYFQKRVTSEIKGLDGKLSDSKYTDRTISYAKFAKEKYVKNLEKNIHSESAQQIHIHLLSDTISKFNNLIAPKVSQLSEDQILEKVEEEIVSHIMALMSRNVLGFNNLTATGAVFFLTGNCHLKW